MALRVTTTPVATHRVRSLAALPPVGPSQTLVRLPEVDIAGVAVHLADEPGARAAIAAAVNRPGGVPLAVASINLDHVHHREALRGGEPGPEWLNLIDGAPIAAQAQRLTGIAWPRLAGSDLITGILEDAAENGWRVAVLGGATDVREPLARRLANDWPGVRFAGHWTPTRDELGSRENSLALAAEIRAARADVLIVCLGKPRQERWIDEYGAVTGAGALLAFGAVVDFLAGRVSRAPRWVAAAGLEWMWRLMLEPRRLAKRYLLEGPPAYMAVRRATPRPRA